MGNLDTRLILKNLCLQQKPNVLLIVETMTYYAHFRRDSLSLINMRSFTLSFRKHNESNLWEFCNMAIQLDVLVLSKQYNSFSFMFKDMKHYMVSIYASTSYVDIT